MNAYSDTRQRAIAIRQPWAWAIIHAGKDVENRSAPRRFQPAVGQRVYIHASLAMTRSEYVRAAAFMADLCVECPSPSDLLYGGVIGSVFVRGIVTTHSSLWFRGPTALVLADARPEPFVRTRGQLGLFRV